MTLYHVVAIIKNNILQLSKESSNSFKVNKILRLIRSVVMYRADGFIIITICFRMT